MKGFLNFVKTTAVGGFFVVLPAALVIFLAGKAVGALVVVVMPVLGDMTARQIAGIGLATLLAIVLLFLICFLAGLLVRTRLGKAVLDWAEGKILQRVPGYMMLKNLTQKFAGTEGKQFSPALVDLYGGGSRILALIVEEHDDGRLAVFVPLTPTVTIGQVYFVSPDQVTPIEAPLGPVMNSLMQWGTESKKLFR